MDELPPGKKFYTDQSQHFYIPWQIIYSFVPISTELNRNFFSRYYMIKDDRLLFSAVYVSDHLHYFIGVAPFVIVPAYHFQEFI